MHWEKIRDDKKWNFQIMTNGEWKSTGHEYDFQSVMHYSSKNFAKDGVGPTMTRRVSPHTGARTEAKSGLVLVKTVLRSLSVRDSDFLDLFLVRSVIHMIHVI